MRKLLETAANIAGVLGPAICLVAGLARVSGHFHLAGYEVMTLFTGGMAIMVFGILLKLEMALHALANLRS